MNISSHLKQFPWLLIAIACTAGVYSTAPGQVSILVWQLSKIAWGAYLGYWIDRTMFPGARPSDISANTDGYREMRADAARMRRALVVGAVVIALGLAV